MICFQCDFGRSPRIPFAAAYFLSPRAPAVRACLSKRHGFVTMTTGRECCCCCRLLSCSPGLTLSLSLSPSHDFRHPFGGSPAPTPFIFLFFLYSIAFLHNIIMSSLSPLYTHTHTQNVTIKRSKGGAPFSVK